MKISVVGCGYLGAVHAASMAQLGHDVVGIDVDEPKVDVLQHGKAPFYEPGFDDLLTESLSSGRLAFSADVAAAADAQVHFVCVGTPQKRGEYAADLRYVEAAVESLLPVLGPGTLVVGKSTVPVGTAARLAELIEAKAPGAMLAWNPEFLREGFAVTTRCTPTGSSTGCPTAARPSGRTRCWTRCTPGSSPTGPRRSSRTTPPPRW